MLNVLLAVPGVVGSCIPVLERETNVLLTEQLESPQTNQAQIIKGN